MNADEIRSHGPNYKGVEKAHNRDDYYWLREIAAQLAELNETFRPSKPEDATRKALRRAVEAMKRLSIADAAHRGHFKCNAELPVSEWCEVNDAIVEGERILKSYESDR